jgi:hypothetical protein
MIVMSRIDKTTLNPRSPMLLRCRDTETAITVTIDGNGSKTTKVGLFSLQLSLPGPVG